MAVITRHGPMVKIVVSWTANGSGDYSEQLAEPLNGYLVKLETIPNAVASSYDVTLTDEYGADLLGGGGLARSNTDNEIALPVDSAGNAGPAAIVYDRPTFTVANATAADGGTAILYFQEKA